MFWKLNIQTFPGTPISAQSEFGKAFTSVTEVKTKKLKEKYKITNVSILDPTATQGPPASKCMPNSYKYPLDPQISKKKKFGHFGALF